MTPAQFKAIRQGAGLTQSALASLLRISDSRTIRRWEDGSRPVSGPVTLLMELLERGVLNGLEHNPNGKTKRDGKRWRAIQPTRYAKELRNV